MKYTNIVSVGLLLSLANITFCAEQKPSWSLYKTLNHTEPVNSAYPVKHEANEFIITCSGNATRAFRIGSDERVAPFSCGEYAYSSCAARSRNFLAVSLKDDNKTHFFVAPGTEIASFFSNRVVSPNHFDSTEEFIATADSEEIKIFNIKNQKCVASFGPGSINDMSFHPTRKILAAVTPLQPDGAQLYIFNFENQEEVVAIEFNEALYSTSINSTGKLLAVGKANSIDIFNSEQQTVEKTISSLNGNVSSLRFDPTGKFLAALCNEKLHIFDLETTKELFVTNHSDNPLVTVQIQCFNHDGTLLVVRCGNKVEIYKLNSPDQK